MDILDYKAMWLEAESGNKEWRDRAEQCIRFYKGFGSKQWDSFDLQKLSSEKRPALTLNKVAPIINFLSGYQRQNKLDIAIVSQKEDSVQQADVMNYLIKQVIDQNNGQYEISLWFDDAIKVGKGWISGYIDYTYDPIKGDIKLERVNPFQVYADPMSSKYDMSDCDYVFKVSNVRIKRVKEAFPDKVDEIMGGGEIDYFEFVGNKHSISTEAYGSSDNKFLLSRLKGNDIVSVKDVWYTTSEQVAYVFIPQTGELIEYGKKDDKLEGAVAQLGEAGVVERQKKVLHRATYLGNVLLQDVKNPLGSVNRIPFIPMYAYRDDTEGSDEVWGVIDNLIDAQREINKRRSQSLHILNTSAHSGWLTEEGAINNETEFRRLGATPGAVLKYKKGATRPERLSPMTPSQGHIMAEQVAETDLKEISGVNPDLLGARGERGEPGVVIQLRQQQGVVVIQSVFDNLRYSLSLLGQLLMNTIQGADIYTEKELQQALPQELQGAVGQIFQDKDMTRFKVSITTQSNTPTARSMDFYKLMEMVKMGFPIPPDILVKASDLPYKDEIISRMQAEIQANMGGTPEPPLNPDEMGI